MAGLLKTIEERALRRSTSVLVLALLFSSPLLSLLLAGTAVTAALWAASRLDVTWRGQRLSVQWRHAAPAFATAHARPAVGTADAERSCAQAGESRGDARATCELSWREAIAAPQACAALDTLVTKIVTEFITELWFKNLSTDPQFPTEVRRLILRFCGSLAPRIRAVNLGALLVRDVCDVFTEQLDVYRRVCDRRAPLLPPARSRLTPFTVPQHWR